MSGVWIREWRRGVLIARKDGALDEVVIGMIVSDTIKACHEAIPAGEELYAVAESECYLYRAIRAVDGVCVGVGLNRGTAESFVACISDEAAGLHMLGPNPYGF